MPIHYLACANRSQASSVNKVALALAAVAIFIGVHAVRAEVIEIGPGDNLEASVDTLMPGDVLVLQGGTYTLPDRFDIDLLASEAQPIVIRAKTGEVPVIVYPSASQNVINIENSAWVTLRGLEVTGGSHGIRILDSDFITIEECNIHDTGDVAVSANVPGGSYDGLRLLHNHIHHTHGTGEGMYLGCNHDACQMFDSLIEGNYIHHTNGPDVSQGDGIEIKQGSYGNIVRGNVIHDTNYPCILTYSTVGNGPPNIIEGNVMWGCGDHAIQVAADAVIRNNIILGAAVDGIRNQPHQAGVPSNLVVVHNTVLAAAGNAYRASGVVGSLVVANNAFFSQSAAAIRIDGPDLSLVTVAGNVGSGSLIGVGSGFDGTGNIATDLVAADYSGTLPQDVFPATGSLLNGAGDPAWTVAGDFNGTPREGTTDTGAYRYAPGGNPGWPIGPGFKPSTGVIFADGFE